MSKATTKIVYRDKYTQHTIEVPEEEIKGWLLMSKDNTDPFLEIDIDFTKLLNPVCEEKVTIKQGIINLRWEGLSAWQLYQTIASKYPELDFRMGRYDHLKNKRE